MLFFRWAGVLKWVERFHRLWLPCAHRAKTIAKTSPANKMSGSVTENGIYGPSVFYVCFFAHVGQPIAQELFSPDIMRKLPKQPGKKQNRVFGFVWNSKFEYWTVDIVGTKNWFSDFLTHWESSQRGKKVSQESTWMAAINARRFGALGGKKNKRLLQNVMGSQCFQNLEIWWCDSKWHLTYPARFPCFTWTNKSLSRKRFSCISIYGLKWEPWRSPPETQFAQCQSLGCNKQLLKNL